jgi:hypothetical protein
VSPGDVIAVDPSFAGVSISGGKSVSFSQARAFWHNGFIGFSQTKAVSIVILR